MENFGILTPGDPNFNLSQKMTEMISKWFFASFRTLPFVFLYGDQESRSWGGGGVQTPPPPPAGGGKSRGPAGRGLTKLHLRALQYRLRDCYISSKPDVECELFPFPKYLRWSKSCHIGGQAVLLVARGAGTIFKLGDRLFHRLKVTKPHVCCCFQNKLFLGHSIQRYYTLFGLIDAYRSVSS